ncbi:hypothetical protein JKP75_00850 [Blastococcus sp. TML/M2B]|uniref:lipid II flippase MurJ n=1 Tax=unclassified Blastococcus TaxID=2619396 RepID=UPI00190A17E2|nr:MULTISPECIES: lipid II flippase MurJ [unclassified Blastococcus]MBN1091271.1 hypothetical protein [Blastococcus sp. TML/M2B]MBN1095172.1 hypothetical protein [Blastococcus sp. TML/C7B]
MTTAEEARSTGGAPGASPRSVARNSATVAAWTLISRATGLLRVVVIGAVLGPTFLANTFLTTNGVPNLAYSVVAGPVLALVVVPAVVRALDRGPEACAAHVRRLSGLLVTVAGAIALALVPVSLVLGYVLTLGVPAPDRGRAQVIATVLLLLVTPQVVLYTVAALGAAAQQARQRFALAAAAPAIENVGLMATMVAVALLHQRGAEVGDVPSGVVLLMGTGATLAVAAHAGLQVIGAHRVGLSLRPARGWREDPEIRAVLVRLRGSVLVAALPAGAFFLLVVCAASMPGGALVFQMAFAVYAVPLALGARAVTTAVMPGMSAAATAGDRSGYAASWRQAIRYGVVAGLPALLVLVAFARPVAGTLAAGDLWDNALIGALAACIAVLAVAQLAAGMHEIGRQALYASLDVRGPQLAGCVAFALTAVCAGAALTLPAGPPRLLGLALTVLIADTGAAATVIARVRRLVRPAAAVDARGLAAVVLAAVPMLPVLAGGRLLSQDDGEALRDVAVLGASGLLATAVFAVCLAELNRRRAAS